MRQSCQDFKSQPANVRGRVREINAAFFNSPPGQAEPWALGRLRAARGLGGAPLAAQVATQIFMAETLEAE